jgi:hypothetical protein
MSPLILLVVLALCFTVPGWAQPVAEIVIQPAAVEPAVLRTVLGTTVMFRNRSQRPIEVEFVGYRGWHHVSETPEGIAVTFHRTGWHPFVVRFSGTDLGHLHGVVEVDAASRPTRALPVCTSIIVRDVCLEP